MKISIGSSGLVIQLILISAVFHQVYGASSTTEAPMTSTMASTTQATGGPTSTSAPPNQSTTQGVVSGSSPTQGGSGGVGSTNSPTSGGSGSSTTPSNGSAQTLVALPSVLVVMVAALYQLSTYYA